jgi:glycosyltransferase involved in cell wall biosynthesis
MAGRLGGRFHPELSGAKVQSFNLPFLASAIRQKVFTREWFHYEQKLNQLFEQRCVGELCKVPEDGKRRVVFAYSYAAKAILNYAKKRGWRTILGQIDPGPRESEIVLAEYKRLGLAPGRLYRPPEGYWEDWREETASADRILVNSRWSSTCLQAVGVSRDKLAVVPCAFESYAKNERMERSYPGEFTVKRPMRVLFLGQTIIRKGIHLLVAAAEQLSEKPIRFVVVGDGLDHPRLSVPKNIEWVGPVSREGAARFYREADLFILPTLSDGFALTQVEALACGLPVMVSRNCGEVVIDGRSGVILPQLDVETLSSILRRLVAAPEELAQMSSHAIVPKECSLSEVSNQLLGLLEE